jgi:hypothetical protein
MRSHLKRVDADADDDDANEAAASDRATTPLRRAHPLTRPHTSIDFTLTPWAPAICRSNPSAQQPVALRRAPRRVLCFFIEPYTPPALDTPSPANGPQQSRAAEHGRAGPFCADRGTHDSQVEFGAWDSDDWPLAPAANHASRPMLLLLLIIIITPPSNPPSLDNN